MQKAKRSGADLQRSEESALRMHMGLAHNENNPEPAYLTIDRVLSGTLEGT